VRLICTCAKQKIYYREISKSSLFLGENFEKKTSHTVSVEKMNIASSNLCHNISNVSAVFYRWTALRRQKI